MSLPPRLIEASANETDRIKKSTKNHRTKSRILPLRKDHYMDDVDKINLDTADENGVVFGAYSAGEYISSTYLLDAFRNKTSTIINEGTWVAPAGFKLSDWVPSITDSFNFLSMNRAILYMPWGLIEASTSRGKLDLEMNGIASDVKSMMNLMDASMKRAENLIEWIHGSRGESVTVPLNYRKPVMSAYPWIKGDIYSYMDAYLNSDSCVLILIGPPGTSKTSFLRALLHHSKADAIVTYDEKIMNSDSLFANFIEGETKFMIMEDADAFLKSRADGNTMMHRFLNVSEGLVSTGDKKLVFSTNLPSVKDIDEALLRPGRCFDILEFRELTRAEAKLVCEEIGKDLPDGDSFTLAELFSVQPSAKTAVKRGVGFL